MYLRATPSKDGSLGRNGRQGIFPKEYTSRIWKGDDFTAYYVNQHSFERLLVFYLFKIVNRHRKKEIIKVKIKQLKTIQFLLSIFLFAVSLKNTPCRLDP